MSSARDSTAQTRSHPRKDMVDDGEGCLRASTSSAAASAEQPHFREDLP